MYQKLWYDYSLNFSEPSLIAAFTNRNFPFISPEDRIELAKSLKLDYARIVSPNQIHSNNVVVCTEPGKIANTDGIITSIKSIVLSIQVADCIPIFLFDKQSKSIGLVHAGWRGVALRIIENSISAFNGINSNNKDIQVILGPSIRQCCFEVGPEVGEKFDKQFQKKGNGDRLYLNLQNVVINKLLDGGIQQKNIFDVPECTCCSDKYHSYRRSGKSAGRMIAMMGWRK